MCASRSVVTSGGGVLSGSRRPVIARALAAALLLGAATALFFTSSSPPPYGQIRVTSVTGEPSSDAESVLRRLGFGFTVAYETHSPAHPPPQGTVMAQDPRAGVRVVPGTIVTLLLQP